MSRVRDEVWDMRYKPMIRFVFGTVFLLVLGQVQLARSQEEPLPAIEIAADTKALFPIADAYIIDSSQNSNFGSATNLRVGYDPTLGYMRSLLWFDVAGEIPSGVKIDSAALQLYVRDASPTLDPPLSTDVYRVDSAWGENSGALE